MDFLTALPEERFSNAESVIEEILLLEKVEAGLNDLENGRTVQDKDIEKELENN